MVRLTGSTPRNSPCEVIISGRPTVVRSCSCKWMRRRSPPIPSLTGFPPTPISIRKNIPRQAIPTRLSSWALWPRRGKVKWITLTDNPDSYIPRFGWVRDGVIWAQLLDRTQDQLDLFFIDAKSGKAQKVLTESSPDAWINVTDDFTILKSGDRFLWSSWRDGHTHLYLYTFN